MRKIWIDSITDRTDTWVEARNEYENDEPDTDVIDVRGGSVENDSDGVTYNKW